MVQEWLGALLQFPTSSTSISRYCTVTTPKLVVTMGIQTTEMPLRVRFVRDHPVEPSVVKRCMKQVQAALSHPLPVEAQTLKLKILETHRIRTSRFSLSHMKRWAIPPVEVPKGLCGPRVLGAMVGGKNVPFSRDMWENRKRKVQKKRLDSIHERITY